MTGHPSLPTPLVSVVMTVYNGMPFLKGSISSILQQSYQEIELIIVDDASTDSSADYCASLDDPRITFIQLEENQGAGGAANIGINKAKGAYIARMDSDDFSHPTRLETQVAFLEKNPDYGVVGTGFRLVKNEEALDNTTVSLGRKALMPISDADIRFRMLFDYPFCHPTLMYRRDVLTTHNINYPTNARRAEDYAVLLAVAPHTKLYNIPACLFSYRKHTSSITAKFSTQNGQDKLEVVRAYHATALGKDFLDKPAYHIITRRYFLNDWAFTKSDFVAFSKALSDISTAYLATHTSASTNAIKQQAAELLWRGCLFKAKGYKRPWRLIPVLLQNPKSLMQAGISLYRKLISHT